MNCFNNILLVSEKRREKKRITSVKSFSRNNSFFRKRIFNSLKVSDKKRVVSIFFCSCHISSDFFHIKCDLFNIYLPQRMFVKLNSPFVKCFGTLSFTGLSHYKLIIFVTILSNSFAEQTDFAC